MTKGRTLREQLEGLEVTVRRWLHHEERQRATGPPGDYHRHDYAATKLRGVADLIASLLSEHTEGEPRVCPECGEPDEGNDAHDGECSQIFPYLSPSELAVYEKLRPCFVEAWMLEDEGEDSRTDGEQIAAVKAWTEETVTVHGSEWDAGYRAAINRVTDLLGSPDA